MQDSNCSYRPLINLRVDVNETRENMINWVHWCKDKGFGGFALIFENNIKSSELPIDWYEKILSAAKVLIKEASKNGLEVWIFDEWGYPSGVASGLVCENKELRSKKLHISYDRFLNPKQTITIEVPKNTVSLKSIPINRFGFYAPSGNCINITDLDNLKEGDIITYTSGENHERVVLVTWEYISFITHVSVINSPDNFNLGTPDLLNPQTAKRFTEVVHDKFYEELKEYYGTVVKGFFYDEPEVCYNYPFTPSLVDVFKKQKGYDIRDNLPIMMAYADMLFHPGYDYACELIDRITKDYFDVWTDMLSKNFYGELQNYCHERGLLSVGHQDMDNFTKTLASVSGHFFKNNKYNDSPGIDVIGNNIDINAFYDFPRFAGSARRLMGKDFALSETFAIMGVAYSPDRLRYVMEHQVIRGINKFFNMITEVQYEEDTSSLFHPGNYINEVHGKNVNDHVSNTVKLASTGIPGADLAIYLPVNDIYLSNLRDSDAHNRNSLIPWEQVDRIAKQLVYMPCDFDYIWDEAITDLNITNGFVTPSGQNIRTIILPPGVNLEGNIKDRLIDFVKSGGHVISILQKYDDCFILCPDFHLLKEYIRPSVQIHGANKNISMCVRKDTINDALIYLFLNENDKEANVKLSFDVLDDNVNIYSVEMTNGDVYRKDAEYIDNTCITDVLFAPCELKCFMVTSKEIKAKNKKILKLIKNTIKCVTIILPSGNRYITDASKLPSWEELGYVSHSGFMEYEIEFDWEEGNLSVDFGKVNYAIIWSLDKTINPIKEGNAVSFAPFIAEIGEVSKGKHILHVYVQNTTINRCIGPLGEQKPSDSSRVIDADRKMVKSGLFGEIRFFKEEQIN